MIDDLIVWPVRVICGACNCTWANGTVPALTEKALVAWAAPAAKALAERLPWTGFAPK